MGGGELGVVVPLELELEVVLLAEVLLLLAVLEAPPAPSTMLVPPHPTSMSATVGR